MESGAAAEQVIADAMAIVDQHLRAVQNKQYKEIARAIGRPVEAVMPQRSNTFAPSIPAQACATTRCSRG